MPRYIIMPGRVPSRTDADMHYVGVGQLRHLYRVPPDADVLVIDGERRVGYFARPDDIVCKPLYSGKYPVFEDA